MQQKQKDLQLSLISARRKVKTISSQRRPSLELFTVCRSKKKLINTHKLDKLPSQSRQQTSVVQASPDNPINSNHLSVPLKGFSPLFAQNNNSLCLSPSLSPSNSNLKQTSDKKQALDDSCSFDSCQDNDPAVPSLPKGLVTKDNDKLNYADQNKSNINNSAKCIPSSTCKQPIIMPLSSSSLGHSYQSETKCPTLLEQHRQFQQKKAFVPRRIKTIFSVQLKPKNMLDMKLKHYKPKSMARYEMQSENLRLAYKLLKMESSGDCNNNQQKKFFNEHQRIKNNRILALYQDRHRNREFNYSPYAGSSSQRLGSLEQKNIRGQLQKQKNAAQHLKVSQQKMDNFVHKKQQKFMRSQKFKSSSGPGYGLKQTLRLSLEIKAKINKKSVTQPIQNIQQYQDRNFSRSHNKKLQPIRPFRYKNNNQKFKY